MSTAEKQVDRVAPPYVAFKSFKNFVGMLSSTGVPTRVDKSVMGTLSGSTQSHLTGAFKFLNLIEENGTPTSKLHQLVKSYGTPDWPGALKAACTEAYEDIVNGIDLEKASARELDGCFESLGLSGSGLDKVVRFYVASLKDSKVAYSSYIDKRKSRAQKSKKPAKSPEQPKQKQKTETSDSSALTESGTPADSIDYPIHFGGGRTGLIRVPSNISAADCRMIELTIPLIKAYTGASDGSDEDRDELF